MTSSSPSRSLRLTVAAIVRDEELLLPAALESVREAADEIVIVDTGSSDDTRRIAAECGAHVIDFPWRHDFSAARNAALPSVTGDWVLWIDAGERLPAGGGPALRDFLETQADQTSGYLVYIEVPPALPGAIPERCARLRLLPNRQGVQFAGRVRESAEGSLVSLGMSVKMSGVKLLRTSLEHDEIRKQAKARRDLLLWDLEDKAVRNQPRCLVALGEIQAALGDRAAAAKYFQNVVATATRGSTEMLEAFYGSLTSLPEGDQQVRLDACLKALDAFPFDAQLLCATGHCLQQQGRFDLAARAYETAVKFGQIDPRTWHLAEIGEVAAHCLSAVWQLQGQDDRAREVLLEALRRLPGSTRLRRTLIDLEIKHDRLLEALAQVEKLPAAFPYREALKTAVRGACQAVRRNWSSAAAYLETAYLEGCREALCLRWHATALLGLGKFVEARQVVDLWLDAEPASPEAMRCLAALQQAESASVAVTPPGMRIDAGQSLFDPGMLSPQVAASIRSLK